MTNQKIRPSTFWPYHVDPLWLIAASVHLNATMRPIVANCVFVIGDHQNTLFYLAPHDYLPNKLSYDDLFYELRTS